MRPPLAIFIEERPVSRYNNTIGGGLNQRVEESRERSMQYTYDIPDSFWSLFRSRNRDVYIEALLQINEEYEYNNYFLSREACLEILSEFYVQKKIYLEKEETDSELDMLETPAARILNWLLKMQWLKKIEDYTALVTNIVIPDYASVFIEAFERLANGDMEDTAIYIQNVYATLYSFQSNPALNSAMLQTALVNTRKLNKALRDMLHNMDRFFGRLLEQKNYGQLLSEHLEGYVEEIVKKKYHILKTSDNFYIYKMDIRECLEKMREDEAVYQRIGEEGMEILDRIERGFEDIERRIANMDQENTKYIRATVTRLNYLLSGRTDTRGLVVRLLQKLAEEGKEEERLRRTAERMNLSLFEVLSEKSFYKRRRPRKDFVSRMAREEEPQELSKEDVLRLNRIHTRYSQKQIEEFIEAHMDGEQMKAEDLKVDNDEDFDKLILAYDYSIRQGSRYQVLHQEGEVNCGPYRYPKLIFVRRKL